MKKTTALLLAVITLAACKPPDTEPETSASPITETAADTTAETTSETASETASETEAKPGESVIERLYNAVVEGRELPVLEPPYLEEMVPDFIGDIENTEGFVIRKAAISAILTEIIIAEAKEGKEDEVYGAVNAHFTSLKESTNLYLQGAAAVAAAIIGKNGNIIYFFCSEDAQDMENTLINALSGES